MRKHLLLGAALVAAGSASAQVITSDDFSYTGALTANGWSAHSGAGNKLINSDGDVATLEMSGGSGEDVNLPFTAIGAADSIYASFKFELPSGNVVDPDGNGLYFAHFREGFSFRARTGVLSPAAGGDFVLALNSDSSNLGAGTSWSGDLSFDTQYQVVIKWDGATGESTLWLDPSAEGDASISHTGSATGTLIDSFAFRQSNDYTGFIEVDDVVVGGTFDDVLPGGFDPWADLGNALAGTNGEPVLEGTGTLVGGDPLTLSLTSALENTTTSLVVGINELNAPLKGGVLVPQPFIVINGLPTDGTGSLAVGSTWPTGFPSAFTTYFQHWIVDPAGPKGLAASNGLSGTTP